MRIVLRVLQRLGRGLVRQRVWVLLALVVILGTGTYAAWNQRATVQANAVGEFPIEVSVAELQVLSNQVTLTLKEKNGSRRISMNVPETEARVIARERGMRFQGDNPQAYDLMRDMVMEMGGRVDRVVVNEANQSTYFAQVIVSSPMGETKVLRARPPDAVALALKMGAPIFVEDKVLEQFGVKSGG